MEKFAHSGTDNWIVGIILIWVLMVYSNFRRLSTLGQGSTHCIVPIMDMSSSYLMLVLLLAMRRTNVVAYVEELDLGLKKGDKV